MNNDRLEQIDNCIQDLRTDKWEEAVRKIAEMGELAVDRLLEIVDGIVPAFKDFTSGRGCLHSSNTWSPFGFALDAAASRNIDYFLRAVQRKKRYWYPVVVATLNATSQGNPRVVPLLAAALNSPNEMARHEALGGLARCRDANVDAIIGCLQSDRSADVRSGAARALGWVRNKRAIPSLIDALNDPAGGVRKWAALTLGAMGDAKAMEALKRSAGAEDDPSVRQHMEAAVEAIQFKQSSGGHTDG